MFLCNVNKLLLFWLVPDSQLTLQKTDVTALELPDQRRKKKRPPFQWIISESSPLKWQIISFIPIISIIPMKLIQNHPNQCKNTRFCNEVIHHFFGVLLLIPMDPSWRNRPWSHGWRWRAWDRSPQLKMGRWWWWGWWGWGWGGGWWWWCKKKMIWALS